VSGNHTSSRSWLRGAFSMRISAVSFLLASTVISLGPGASAQTFTSTDTPIGWPDLSTINSNINVPAGLGVITDVNVEIDFSHSFWADSAVSVTHGATTVELYSFIIGGQDASGSYTFDDEAVTNISAAPGDPVTPGTYSPQAASALAAFDGLDPTGTWTLTMSDQAFIDSGNLNIWRLIFSVGAIDQAKIGPTIPAIISGDVTSLVGSYADRATARYAGGVEPAADVVNPYLPGGTGGLWLRLGGSIAEGEGEVENLFIPTVASYDKDTWLAQGGFSHVLYDSGDKKWVGSIFGHYSKSDADVSDQSGPVGSVNAEGFGLGYSSTWLFSNGFYVDSLSLAHWQDIDVATAGATGSTDALTLASSAELGMKINLGNSLSLVPQLQGVYQRVDIDSFTDSAGSTYAFSDNDSLVGRAGIGLNYDETSSDSSHRTEASLTGSVLEEFMDSGATVINGTSLGFSGIDTASWQIAGHLAFTPVSSGFGLGLNASYRDSFESEGESAFGGDVMLSWRW